MPFTILQNSTTAYAEEVMDNFYHIANGDRLPRGAGSMTAIDATYNLGSDANKWKNLYANKLYVDAALTSTSLLNKIAQVTFSTGTTSSDFTISGFNGDRSNLLFSIYLEINGTDTVFMYFNNDTQTNYSFKTLFLNPGAGYVVANTSASGLEGFTFFSTYSTYFLVKGEIFSKTGSNRIIKTQSDLGHIFYTGIWSNTTSTITSIGFYTTGVKSFNKFTKITFWEAP